jgi:hypothetical protein
VPIEQEVVQVETSQLALALFVGAEEIGQRVQVLLTPGELAASTSESGCWALTVRE